MIKEEVVCNLCGENDTDQFCFSKSKYEEDFFQLVKCKNCKLIYVNPRLNVKEMAEGYKMDPSTIPYYGNLFKGRKRQGNLILSHYLKPLLGDKRGSFLEIGAGTGAMLASAKELGFNNVIGLELNLVAADYARENHGFQMFSEDICEASLDTLPSDIDCVFSYHTFEHLYDPYQAMKNVYDLLKPGGLFVVIVPQINFLPRYIKKGRIDKSGELDASAHVYQFSLNTLSALFKKAGLEIVLAEPGVYYHKAFTFIPKFLRPLLEPFSPSIVVIGRK